MIFGYGIVDKDNVTWWEGDCVSDDRLSLESAVDALNDYDDPRAPYRVVPLHSLDTLPSRGAIMIAAERQRQIQKGFTPDHDDQHTREELAAAAVAYILAPLAGGDYWPWFEHDGTRIGFKPHGYERKQRLHDLVVAGAFLAAEIDRLSRLEHSSQT